MKRVISGEDVSTGRQRDIFAGDGDFLCVINELINIGRRAMAYVYNWRDVTARYEVVLI